MSVLFKIYDAAANEVSFDTDQATDTGYTKGFYTLEMAQEKAVNGEVKQQIRPGIRFNKIYEMNLIELDYIAFINLITNNADDYYIQYTTAPTVLTNNSTVTTTNDFKIAMELGEIKSVLGEGNIYKFDLTIVSVNLL